MIMFLLVALLACLFCTSWKVAGQVCSDLTAGNQQAFSCSNGFNPETVCTFQCDRGFELHGGPYLICEKRSESSFVWSELDPLCRAASGSCTPLTAPANAEMTCNNDFIMGVICSFSCSPGYELDTTSPSICNHLRQWNNPTPSCSRAVSTCDPALEAPEHGSMTCTNLNKVGTSCLFSCDVNFVLSDETSPTCVESSPGTAAWSAAAPTCYNTCQPALPNPLNGATTCSAKNTENSVCSFSCEPGYLVSEMNVVRTCVNTLGVWNWDRTSPTCDVAILTCDPALEAPEHGSMTCTNLNKVGTSCSFLCDVNFVLSDETRPTCIESSPDNVAWSAAAPTCYNTCQPAVPNPLNGSATCTAKNTEDSVCSFSCEPGYLISEVNVVMTCVNTLGVWNWDRTSPTCDEIPVRCPELHSSQFTMNTLYRCTEENKRGSICTFRCDNGAELSTNVSDSTCVDPGKTGIGKWEPNFPECFFSACEKPGIANGKSTCADIVPGSVCQVSCFSGFLPSSPTSFTCTKQGTWEGIIPSCNPGPCLPALEIILGKATCSNGNKPGSRCDVTCRSLSKPEKPAQFTCADPSIRNGAGFWSDGLLECVGCGKGLLDIFLLVDASANLTPPDFGEMMKWLAHLVGSLGKFFDLGSAWIALAVSGSKEPGCDPRQSLSFFHLEIPLRSLGVPILVQKIRSLKPIGGCFHLGGSMGRAVTHLVERQRPHVTPVVMLLISGPSFDDFSGAVTMANAAGVKFIVVGFGGAKTFKFTDITEDKESIVFIPAAELFPSAAPHVINIISKTDCPGFSVCAGPIANGQVICKQAPSKKIPFDEVCSANCNKGYALVGNSTALCGDANGDGIIEWISPIGVCKEIRCPEREPPKDGFVSCDNGNVFPSLCKYFCIPNYFMIGLSQSFCADPDKNGEGDWSSEIPRCVENLLCLPTLSPPQHGSMECTKNNMFGSQCHFTCEDRFEIAGNGILNCGNALPDGSVEWGDGPPSCKQCKTDSCRLDLMMLMDGSGSIRSRQFNQMKEWVIKILNGYKGEIDSGGTRVGLIQFSGEATFMCDSGEILPKYEVELELAQYTFYEVQSKIRNIGHLKGCTATGDAITRGVKHFDAVGRLEVDQVMIIVTDGKSNDDVIVPAEEARKKNIKLVAIGIGKFEPKELQEISGAKSVIDVSSFDELDPSISAVQDEIQNQIEQDFTMMLSSGIRPTPNIFKIPATLFIFLHFTRSQ